MTWRDLKQKALKDFYPALVIERSFSHRLQLRIRTFVNIFIFIAILSSGAVLLLSQTSGVSTSTQYLVYGISMIILALWLKVACIRSIFYWYYFKGVPDLTDDRRLPLTSFELAYILYRSPERDPLAGLLRTREGIQIVRRAGINKKELLEYVKSRKPVPSSEVQIETQDHITLADYVLSLFDADATFAQFLFEHGIQKKELTAICDWVLEREMHLKRRERWWSRDRLGRIPGIGKNWSYGQIYNVQKYSLPIPETESEEFEIHSTYGSKELRELEEVLVRTKEANVLLVGNDKAGKMGIISRLNNMIDEGTALPELEHKRIILLDSDLITATSRTKSDFETTFIALMQEAEHAGNLILIFSDFPSFMQSADALGSDIVSLLDPYLTSHHLQVVALADNERFHIVIEKNSALMQRFERILLEGIDELNTIRVLENEIVPYEHRGLYFTYSALSEIAVAAERYFADAIMPDKAIDLLLEIVPRIAEEGRRTIRKEDVLDLIKEKTGIPVGTVGKEEREKLLNLEKFLHQRVIGQDEAINAISNAVRRARSGINSPNRPIGSFLFLGPTGVGKTETTKALAETFFGTEATIERLDMSEYAGDDALMKLIGAFNSNRPGVLSKMVREHPYGVLLLDEFEKTTPEVMNLFLQILDEGFFSDMGGQRINARNLLIIATSNAGSDLIWEAVKHGENPAHSRDLIIDSIIKTGIFKPELLNRFDGVIVFHPLASEHLEKIARLQLGKLRGRLAERGINLVISDALVLYLMKYGTDPKFGARPMNRAIQDKVEQIIAEKIIKGEYRPGMKVELSPSDLGN